MKWFSRKKWLGGPLLLAALCTTVTHAGPDELELGSGRDGDLSVRSPGQVINAYAQVTGPLAPGDTAIPVSSTRRYAAGDLAMVLQMMGPAHERSPDTPGPIDVSREETGRWELVRVASVSGDMLVLEQPLQRSYAAEVTQVIRVPEYGALTIASEGSLVAQPWDGRTGGVVAFLARGVVRNDGRIEARGVGFRASPSLHAPELHSGGRGLELQAGGGGGGHGGAGGQGGRPAGSASRSMGGPGGVALEYSLSEHLLFGGGGAGQGAEAGWGGGILFIQGRELTGRGSLSADGAAGALAVSGGGNGGGAGGSISLRFSGSIDCGSLTARGGEGGSIQDLKGGPGGGGAGGRVFIQAEKLEATCDEAIDVSGGGVGSRLQATRGEERADAQAGQRGTVTVRTLALLADTTPPNTSITSGPNTLTNQRDATFDFNANESPVTYECRLDAAATFMACSDPVTFTGLGEGSHTLRVQARDAAGNVDPTPASYSWTVDVTPPAAPTVSTPTAGVVLGTTTPTFSGTAEANSSVTVIVDGSFLGSATADASGNWSFTVPSALAEGNHTLRAIATDTAGNDSGSTDVHFLVDTQPPETSIVSGPAVQTNQTNATFDFDATETPATYECSLDGAAFAPCTEPLNLTGLAEGPHSLEVRARDGAGLVDASPASYSWTVDLAAPDAPVISEPANGAVLDTATPAISGTAEPGSTVTLIIDGAAAGTTTADGAGNWTFIPATPLADGGHSVKATATDAATNISLDSKTHTFSLDVTPPDTTITSGPAASTTAKSATFTFTSTEPGSTFECGLDGAGFAPCTTPVTFSGLAVGKHSLEVRAVDAAGNADPTPAIHDWQVTSPPKTPGCACSESGSSPAVLLTGLLGLIALGSRRRDWGGSSAR